MMQDFQQAVEQHGLTLYRLAFSYLGNRPDAEDAVQEAFVRYLSAEKEFESDDHRLNWLLLVTANLCRDLLRSGWKRKRADLDELPEPASQDIDEDARLAVRQAVEKLPPEYRAVVFLYYFEDYPVRRIGEALGLSETAVWSRLYRARKKLRRSLGGGFG